MMTKKSKACVQNIAKGKTCKEAQIYDTFKPPQLLSSHVKKMN